MIEQVTGQAIIDEIINNMHQGLEPLHNTTLVPSIFNIHLHPEDYERLQGILPVITREADSALGEELARLNKKGWPFALKKRLPRYQTAQDRWVINFFRDADDDVQKGEILIDSQLAFPAKPDYGVGGQTVRIRTIRSNVGESKSLGKTYEQTETIYATISYHDKTGRNTYKMTKPEIVIGRGGKAYITDLKLQTSPDVSREHLRIRFDPPTRKFYLRDLSTLGTTVNGFQVPSSIEVVGETKQDKNIEVALPERARIGLAEVLFLDFQSALNG
jgi:hypothetical protein